MPGIPFNRRPEPPPKPEPPKHTYVAELLPEQRDELLALVKKQMQTPTWLKIREALELAERLDLVPAPRVDWDRRERWAQAGYSLVDQFADGFRAASDPKDKGDKK